MEDCINFIKGMLDAGHVPTEIRVDDPWKSAVLESDIFTGDSPLLADSSIVIDASAGDENVIVFVAEEEYRAVLST